MPFNPLSTATSLPSEIGACTSRSVSSVKLPARPLPLYSSSSLRRSSPPLSGTAFREPLGCDRTLYVTVTRDDYGTRETFIKLGKIGGCVPAWAESLGRAVSLFLRMGGDPERIIDSLRDVRCPEGIESCPNIIARILEEEETGGKSD